MFTIYPYHGVNEELLNKLKNSLGEQFVLDSDRNGPTLGTFHGTIKEFDEKWDGNFLVMKNVEKGYNPIICVSIYNNFHQR